MPVQPSTVDRGDTSRSSMRAERDDLGARFSAGRLIGDLFAGLRKGILDADP